MDSRFLIDYETRSQSDLTKVGAHVYASHPSTQVLCLGWINIDDRSQRGCWRGWPSNDALPEQLFGAKIYAWNAQFEEQIWNEVCTRMGWPRRQTSDFICIMKMSAHAGMPLALDKGAPAADLAVKKNMDGHKMMLKWCKPLPQRGEKKKLGVIEWADDPAEYEILCRYADEDCDVELAMLDRLEGTVSNFEQAIMHLDAKINNRGFRVDTHAAEGAAKIAREEVLRLNGEMRRLTNGEITTCNQRERIITYAARHGVALPDLKSATVRDTLAGEEDNGTEMELLRNDLPAHIRTILEVRAEAGKASVAKLAAFTRGTGADGHFRGGFAYGGAAKTLRWAGRRVQPHNFARDNPPSEVDEETWYDALTTGDREYFASLLPDGMTVMDGLKASLRGMILP